MLIKLRKTIEDFGILQYVVNYISETQTVGERPYGSTHQPPCCWHKPILNWRRFKG